MTEQIKNDKEQANDMIRIINRVNTAFYTNKPPESISVDQTGSYTLGLMDTRRLEVLSVSNVPENAHRDIIDACAMAFLENKQLADYIREHVVGFKEATVFNMELDKGIPEVGRIIYVAAFRDTDFKPAAFNLLERTPKYWVMLGTSQEEVEQQFADKAHYALATE